MTQGQMRLALRVEGTRWVAYIAQIGTMEKAVEIGSITMRAVEDSAEYKQQFMELMKEIMGHLMKTVTNATEVSWPNPPEAAPESERSGRG